MVRITSVAKQLPPYTRSTSEILPFIEAWLSEQDSRFQRKVLKIFRNAGVDRRYSIIPPEEMFVRRSFAENNDGYIEGVIKTQPCLPGESAGKSQMVATGYRLHHHRQLYRIHDPFRRRSPD
jgi:alkylresorcinol/alkylpyrone synthase